MHLLSSNTVSSTVLSAYNRILQQGHIQSSRNGAVRALYDVTLEVTNPRSRHLCLSGRKSNIFQMIAETFWVMAGHDKIEPYLTFFLPRAPNYSDDGKTWHGAYGPRLYAYDQINEVVRLLKLDRNTRRAVLNIAMPEHDSGMAIFDLYGSGQPKDIPCNREIHFYFIGKKLNMKVIQRSGDVLFGAGSINPFEFTFLHELVYNAVRAVHNDAELGSYKWHVTNLHLYSEFQNQVDDAVKYIVNDVESSHWENNQPLIGVEHFESTREFFHIIVNRLTCLIEGVSTYEEVMKDLDGVFNAFEVPTKNNLLWIYVECVVAYIMSKKGVSVVPKSLEDSHYEFYRSIEASPFRKFPIE